MKRAISWALLSCVVLAAGSLGAETPQSAAAPFRVLLVDCTTTLESTLRVGGLAGGIRQSGLAELTVLFSDVASPYDDPLAGKALPTAPFDLILVVPRGVGDGAASVVWLLVAGNPEANPTASSALKLLGAGMSLVFGSSVSAAGPLDDLWAALTASLYVAEGWLR
jgi:hypothetical protein